MRAAPDTNREGGFTLIELMIVLVIVGILMAAVVTTQSGTKDTVKRQEAIVAAHSLQKAVEGFRRDREGRVPSRSGPAPGGDWPIAARGPIDADAGRPYLRARWPEAVRLDVVRQAGGSVVQITARHAGVSTSGLAVEYRSVAASTNPWGVATTYRITVRHQGSVVCVLTNDPSSGADTC